MNNITLQVTPHIKNSWVSGLRNFVYCKLKMLTVDKNVARNTATFHMRGPLAGILKKTRTLVYEI
jgi:hypothetical protein